MLAMIFSQKAFSIFFPSPCLHPEIDALFLSARASLVMLRGPPRLPYLIAQYRIVSLFGQLLSAERKIAFLPPPLHFSGVLFSKKEVE